MGCILDTLSSVWNWAVTQFNYAVGGIKQLWYKLVDFLSSVKDSIVSLMSSLKAGFCYSTETATFTRWTSVPSTPGGEFIERVKVQQRKTEFEFEVGEPAEKRRRTRESQENLEKGIKIIDDTVNQLTETKNMMEQYMRATTIEETEKTTAKFQDFLESDETKRVMAALRQANFSIV